MKRLFLDTNIIQHVASHRLGRSIAKGIPTLEIEAAAELFNLQPRGACVLVLPDRVRRELYGIPSRLISEVNLLRSKCELTSG